MTQEQKLDFLIDYLIDENIKFKQMKSPQNLDDKKDLFRSLCNVREPKEVSKDFLKIQNEYLKAEIEQKGIVNYRDIAKTEANNIYLWQGDITSLKVDAIVNAGNSKLLGCFYPLHNCIDNAIHSFAGVELRNECYKIMNKQGEDEKMGFAKITKAYNLPSKNVIHTVGPIVRGQLSDKNILDLVSCYEECLKLADSYKLKSIAFCCISTGEYCFPNVEAGEIAVSTVKNYLLKTNSEIEVVFNVFKEIDYEIYKRLLY
ncbi:MAG: protein-ADP-ribose hydrolase [Lachnospirales bacterium]